ncbi:MAG TPA: outer membrane lipoprotein carrier protein LolA [Candidatus Hydrogenedens sp.]|nr:outer membrane lipoprotein carrier protein LolA [Candidatus Hydrogenedens sp.]
MMIQNKSYIFFLPLILIFVSLHFSLYCQDTEEDRELDTFFKKYTESREKIDVLVATFQQKNIYPDEIYTTFGSLVFVKPQRMVFTTDEPKKYTVIEEKRIYEYEPDIKQITIYDLKDSAETELFFFAFAEDLNTLRKKYHVLPIRLSDERGKQGISIRPFTDKEEDSSFEEIVLYLQDDTFLPYRLRIVNEDNVQTIVDFEHIEINNKIRLEDTQIYLPPGTNVIENDKYKETITGEGKRIPDPAKLDPKYVDTSPKTSITKKEESEKIKEENKPQNIPEESNQIEIRDLEPIKK